MDIVTLGIRALAMDREELNKLLNILKYCKHRAYNHPESGAKSINKKFVDYMIEKIEGV